MRGVLLAAAVLACACAGRQEPESVAKARELMRSAETPSGNLALRCEPVDAEVYLDGVLQGLCSDFTGSPKSLRVGAGLHHIEVKKQGFWPYTTYYEPSGARARLTIQLRSAAAPGGGAP
ncbi:PEGA domain-containing protein [Pyxidicoccus parkwayensis]|uniref:PEGA domain-containing protein n=1 Tax=Pyxidicoccus parkwayensis TaxID=2813578 RepID=A0ABX7P7C6_9BACT|nr:PEGA domain-containing protein [Pyxidicoccus parkwaysis]QSQ26389.1 PEGA domain-containing protein [Pyxidicoccus parkwaysis]